MLLNVSHLNVKIKLYYPNVAFLVDFVQRTVSGKPIALLSIFEFQKCGILTSVDLDEPVQPPFKVRNYK